MGKGRDGGAKHKRMGLPSSAASSSKGYSFLAIGQVPVDGIIALMGEDIIDPGEMLAAEEAFVG